MNSSSYVIGSKEFRHRAPRIKKAWKGAHLQERRTWMNGMFIDYPDVKEVLVDAIENVEASSASGTSVSMHVIAESGGGKTTLVNELDYLVSSVYSRDDPEKTVKPVLQLSAPSPCTPTELCYVILEALGDLHPRSRGKLEKQRSLKEITADLLNQCEVRLVLFDNFQDIPSARRARGIEQVGICLRDLIDMTQCTWIFLGTEESRAVVNAKSQLIKRVAYEKVLRYFSLHDGQAEHFLRLLQRLDDWLPLAEPSLPALQANGGLIYIATAGILDRITKLLDRAWPHAMSAGRESLSKEDLGHAFKKLFGSDRENPFNQGFVIRHLNGVNEPYENFGSVQREKPNEFGERRGGSK